ncbi:hypothetical protein [Moorella stamsii (nom. illeg.)]|uniref:hypothetical protein n=1 Tax=Neomoorella stamsii TaxID=1266720 RepID=UPI000A547962|nr:hypothetical protein [Moorella stamsii]
MRKCDWVLSCCWCCRGDWSNPFAYNPSSWQIIPYMVAADLHPEERAGLDLPEV